MVLMRPKSSRNVLPYRALRQQMFCPTDGMEQQLCANESQLNSSACQIAGTVRYVDPLLHDLKSP
jgi:hypothetical protein